MDLVATFRSSYWLTGRTVDDEVVEFHEWDVQSRCWVGTDGRRHSPNDLILATPETLRGGSFALTVPLEGIGDFGAIRVVAWNAGEECWLTDDGEKEDWINCPRPSRPERFRSLDADWQS